MATESIRSPLNSWLYASRAEAEAKAATKSRATELISNGCGDRLIQLKELDDGICCDDGDKVDL